MKENFCDIQKNMAAQKELQDTKMWAKILFWLLMIMGIMFIYMCYWYGQEKSDKEFYKSMLDSKMKLDSCSGDTILCKVDTSYMNSYYQVSMKDKKIMRILISNGFEMDTTYLEPLELQVEK